MESTPRSTCAERAEAPRIAQLGDASQSQYSMPVEEPTHFICYPHMHRLGGG